MSLQGLEEELGLGPSVAKPSETGMQVARRRRKKVSKSESPRESSRSASSSSDNQEDAKFKSPKRGSLGKGLEEVKAGESIAANR